MERVKNRKKKYYILVYLKKYKMSFYETGNLPNFSVLPTPSEYDKVQDFKTNNYMSTGAAQQAIVDGSLTIGTIIYNTTISKFVGLTGFDSAGNPVWAVLN